MKIAVIGDIHSRLIWKEIAEDAINKVDKIIFTGDYVDPYPIYENVHIHTFNTFSKLYEKVQDWEDGDENLTDEEFIKKYYSDKYLDKLTDYEKPLIYPTYQESSGVLNDIINFKKKNSNNVILLIGNHDAHYIYDEIQGCGRYDIKNSIKYKSIYKTNKNLFQYAYQDNNYLFTHAGVSNSWLDFFDATLESFGLNKDNSNIGEVLNKMGENTLSNKILNAIGYSRNGKAPYGGITWADYEETFRDYLDGFHQVVGHSKVNYITTERIPSIPGSITYVDILETPNKNMKYNYYIVDTTKI